MIEALLLLGFFSLLLYYGKIEGEEEHHYYRRKYEKIDDLKNDWISYLGKGCCSGTRLLYW